MNKGVVIFIEGETDEELYKNFRDMLHSMCEGKKFIVDAFEIINLKGIGSYKNKAVRVFTRDILVKNPDTEFEIFLSYDTDVFEFSPNPPIDWTEVDRSLKLAGAKNVFHVKVKHSIED